MFGRKNNTPELTNEQIRDLAMELITNKKAPGNAGLKRNVRLRVEGAINQIAYEAVLKEKIASGQMQVAKLAIRIFDEIIDYEPEGKKHIPRVEIWVTSYTRNGGDVLDTLEEAHDETIPAKASLNIASIQNILSSLQHPNANTFRSKLAIALRILAADKNDSFNVYKTAMEKAITALGL
jgi:hypothetical protein